MKNKPLCSLEKYVVRSWAVFYLYVFILLLFIFVPQVLFADGFTKKQAKYVDGLVCLFDDYYVPANANCEKVLKVRNKLRKRLAKLPKGMDGTVLADYFYNQVKCAVDTAGTQQLLKEIERYVVFFPTDRRVENLLRTKADLFVGQGNWMQLDKTIRQLVRYAEASGRDCSVMVREMSGELVRLMASESYGKTLQGVWVSDTVDKKSGMPLFMFRVYKNGVELLEGSHINKVFVAEDVVHSYKHPLNKKKLCRDPLYSCFFYSYGSELDSIGVFRTSFFTRIEQHAQINLAMTAIDNAQKSASSAIASAVAGNTAKATAGVVAAGVSVGLAYLMSQSYVKDLCMTLEMTPVGNNVADAKVLMIKNYSKSTDPAKMKENTAVLSTRLYKVNSADEMVLYRNRKKPFPLYDNNAYTDEVVFNELDDFKKIQKPFYAKTGAKVAVVVMTGLASLAILPFMNGGKKAKATSNFDMMKLIKQAALDRQSLIDKYRSEHEKNEEGIEYGTYFENNGI